MYEGMKRSCNFWNKQQNSWSKDKVKKEYQIDIYEYEEFVA